MGAPFICSPAPIINRRRAWPGIIPSRLPQHYPVHTLQSKLALAMELHVRHVPDQFVGSGGEQDLLRCGHRFHPRRLIHVGAVIAPFKGFGVAGVNADAQTQGAARRLDGISGQPPLNICGAADGLDWVLEG
jgi:hypothetical protein